MKYYLYLSAFIFIKVVSNEEHKNLSRDKRQFYPEYIFNNTYLPPQETLQRPPTYQQQPQYLPLVTYNPIQYRTVQQPNVIQPQYFPENKPVVQSPFAPQFGNIPQQPQFTNIPQQQFHPQSLGFSPSNHLYQQAYQNPYLKSQPVILVQPDLMPKFNEGPMYMQKHTIQDICRNYLPEEKTAIYVLVQKPNFEQEVVQPVPTEAPKPEVFFVNYKTPEEADLVQQKIQEQYDALGGTSEVTHEKSTSVKSAEVLEGNVQSESNI